MFLADRIGFLASVLVLVFTATVLAAILPAKVMDPAWQFRMTGTLIDNAPVPLIGLALIHLAVYLDPNNKRLLRRRQRFSALALAAALAFLLLIPLQASVLIRGLGITTRTEYQNLRIVDRELAGLTATIRTAKSTADLVAALPPQLVQTLGPDADRMPLAELRRKLEQDVRTARKQLGEQIARPASQDASMLWRRSLRVMFSALLYGLAFLAFALVSGTEVSLLLEIQLALPFGK